MQAYWIVFEDESRGCCEGQSEKDAIYIAENLTGKKVAGNDEEGPAISSLPYPANPIIWQFDHPIYGKTPGFCMDGERCHGLGSCPRDHACND